MDCINIKTARNKKGITQAQLAELLDYGSYATISAWELNKNSPSIEMVERMAQLFDCDPAYLTGSQDYPKKEYNEYSKYTGLSYDAIEVLHDASSSDPAICDIISDIIKNSELLRLIKEARIAASLSSFEYLSDDMIKEKQLRELAVWEELRRFMGDIK